MNQESLTHLDRVIHESSLELFAAYNVRLETGEFAGKRSREIYAATIGFTCPELKGAIVITLCRGLAVNSLPPQLAGRAGESSIVADWTGELSNQLLGRIKRKLAGFGIDIALSTPVVFKGQGLDLYPQQAEVHRRQEFGHGSGACLVVFQARVAEGFELEPLDNPQDQGMQEGDIALF
jgi:CheY-specific phosphatase CheX